MTDRTKDRVRVAGVTVLGLLAVAILGGLLVVYTGAYNVAATQEHWGLTQRILDAVQRGSVSARADQVTGSVPTDSAAIAQGFEHFHVMCVQCHGAPGVPRGELGQGMNPVPPRLEEVASSWTDAELFWITRHGIRLAGMPAFGSTHSDEEIWQIVAFVGELERMSAEDYARRAASRGGEEGGPEDRGHHHEPGTADHEH